MFKSLNEDPKTFPEKVVDYIRELILDNKLEPGDKLPSERKLAEMMEVSRPTIREAYKLLSAMGFLKIQHGTGVFVADPDERIDNWASLLFLKNDTIHELFEVRKVLESESAAWATERATQEALDTILENSINVYEFVKNEHFESTVLKEQYLFESDQKFHTLIAEAAGNTVGLRVMNNLIDLLIKSRLRSMKIPGRVEQSLLEHIEIAKALVARDKHLAKEKMRQHLDSVHLDISKEIKEERT